MLTPYDYTKFMNLLSKVMGIGIGLALIFAYIFM